MLNSRLKKESIRKLKRESEKYAQLGEKVQKNSIQLFNLRTKASETIVEVEKYINTLANTPKEFDSTISEVKVNLAKFNELLNIEYDEKKANQVSGGIAGAGVAMGVGVAAFGPSAAMAIATTFGTASTGAAISSLYGAAATNAALAWLGGGALAAGGGGMAAGNAFLAMAGPVGWAIGGTALIGGALFANKKNKDLAIKAQKETVEVQKQIAVLNTVNTEVVELIKLTSNHFEELSKQLTLLAENAPGDYQMFTLEQKHGAGSLVNNTLSLSKLINRKVGN